MRSATAFWRPICFLAPLLLGRPAAAQENPQFQTLDDVSSFIQTYYQQPRPELIGDLIRALSSVTVAQRPNAVPPLVGFLSEVFAANRSRMAEWRTIPIDDQTTQRLVGRALNLSQYGGVMSEQGHSAELNDMYWGAFFATGSTTFLQKLVDQLRYYDERDDEALFLTGATAKWSLASNARSHPLVHSTLAGNTLATDQRTRDIVIQLLAQDPARIKQETAEIVASQRRAGKWQ
jgi:hypothetical protein